MASLEPLGAMGWPVGPLKKGIPFLGPFKITLEDALGIRVCNMDL